MGKEGQETQSPQESSLSLHLFLTSWIITSMSLYRLTFSESPGIRHKTVVTTSVNWYPSLGQNSWLIDLTWSRIYTWSTHQRSREWCQKKNMATGTCWERSISRDEGHGLHGDQKHVVGAMLHHEIPPSELNGWLPQCLGVLPTAISTLWELFLNEGSHLALPQLHPFPETPHI